MKNKPEAVETEAEELLFYSDKERDAALGTIGHLRIDFGRSGEEFNCTWFDHANSGKNDSYFKESFDMFIDDLRTGVLKSRTEMRKFCYRKDECRNSHSYTEDCWGFRVLSDRYAYYIRCTPGAGDYECYIYAYDKTHLMEFLAEEKKLPEHCYSRLASTGEPILIRYAEKRVLSDCFAGRKHSGRDERINRCYRSTEDGNGSGQYVRLACAGG